jgi:hypothetical protein
MSSLTLEDVFYCHERNSLFYLKDPFDIPEVYPLTIGENTIEKSTEYFFVTQGGKGGRSCLAKEKKPKDIYANLQKRHYIKIGEECPICYEGIFHKRDAQLTDCGHAFHYSCLQQYCYSDKTLNTACPLCREPFYHIDKNRYSLYSPRFLDILEDFWMNSKTRLPEMCFSVVTNEKVHITGTENPKCHICRVYCK